LGRGHSRILFVVGGHNILLGIACARRAQAFFVGLYIVLPEFAFFEIATLNFQFFSGSSIRARKRFRCSSLREMQEEFDDALRRLRSTDA
jgi:hypothetical protein